MRIEHWLYTLPLRLRSLFRRDRVEQDLDDELNYHMERQIEQYVAQGQSPEQAGRAALRAMDGFTQRKEECRDTRRVHAFDDLAQDIRYGMRVLAKSPGFTSVAVLTLALAIGANAVVFGILNALVLRPLNVPRAESLYGLQRNDAHFGMESYRNYLDCRDRNRSFESLAGYSVTQAGLDTGDNPSRVWVVEATGNYFDVMGLKPHLGRFFHSSDEHGPNSAPYVVLSYAYWHSHFSDDRGVVGRVVRLNKHPFTILGVAPKDYHGTIVFFFPDVFVPLLNTEQVEGYSNLDARNVRWVFQTLGHLKPGITPAQAITDLNTIGGWLQTQYPKEVGAMSFKLVPPGLYGDYLGRPVKAFVAGLMLLAGLILLAACANLGSLFAARAADRSREVALRLALGASRNRILRTLFTEAVMIALMGGAAGLAGSVVLLRWLSVWQPVARFPINIPVTPDTNVYLAALLLALVSGALFGIVPVRQVLRTNPYQVIKAGPGGAIGRRLSARDLLLVTQITICAVLVTSSMVAVRGLMRSLDAEVGVEPRHAMLVNTILRMAGYSGEAMPGMQRRMIDSMQAIPGVDAVALVTMPPLEMGAPSQMVYKDETTDLRPSNMVADALRYSISPDYFQAARTRLLSGRSVTWHDDQNAPTVAVINREFARKVFGSTAKAMGSYFRMRGTGRVQVVGIVEDGKYVTLTEDATAAMFLPILQAPSNETWLVIRSNREERQLATAIQANLRKLDAGLPYYMQTWTKELEGALFASRVATVALGIMGMLGAMLAITGIFGMAAYSVSKRLRELGIRMALGARRQEILQAGLGRALKLLAVGSAAGMILGVLSTRVLASIVYEATPRDPLVLAGVIVAMLFLGLLATWIPAQRALSLNPLTLLREE
jgi:predicted permease